MTTSVIEAFATGLPVIATLHSGFPEQIEEGKSGFLVPEGDYEALAEKILYLIDHDEVWASFGEQGRKCVSEKYDSDKLISDQISLYASLTDSV